MVCVSSAAICRRLLRGTLRTVQRIIGFARCLEAKPKRVDFQTNRDEIPADVSVKKCFIRQHNDNWRLIKQNAAQTREQEK